MSKELEEILDRWKLYISFTKNFSNKDMELLKIEEIEELLDYISNLQQENKQLKETLKDIEELLLSEEQPVQPCNIRYDILEIIKKALGGKE